MADFMAGLAGHRVVAELPAGLDDWMAACEVLFQEGVRAWAFPIADLHVAREALKIFGRRARIGVRGITTFLQTSDAAAAGVHFLTSPIAHRELIPIAALPVALGALTPNEVQEALRLGAPAVQIVPADAFGMAYGRALGELFRGQVLLATGRLERYQCDMWLETGASAVGLTPGVLFPESDQAQPTALDLDALRRRAQAYSDLA